MSKYTTMFELEVGQDIGDIESGPLVQTGTDYYETSINLSQPLEQMFEEVRKRYLDEYQGYVDWANVKRIVPRDEAKRIREDMCLEDDPYGIVY